MRTVHATTWKENVCADCRTSVSRIDVPMLESLRACRAALVRMATPSPRVTRHDGVTRRLASESSRATTAT